MLLAASGLLLGVGNGSTPAEAACMPPTVTVTPRTADPGDNVVITGRGWKEGCNDTVACTQGGPCSKNPDAPPRMDIDLRFSQGRNTDSLGNVDADDDSRFTFTAQIPLWAKAGAATVMADSVVTGFYVTSGEPGGTPTVVNADAFSSEAGSNGEPLAKTGLETSPVWAVVLAVAAAFTRRLSRTR